ncbi:MAG: hypothetical protein J2P51_00405 [Hyphomicrobiaceae bacterium]|nr:hypothetical protein [Hyphomicrobiaceae bacterium]
MTPRAGDPVAGVIWISVSRALFAFALFSRQAMDALWHAFEVVLLRNACA